MNVKRQDWKQFIEKTPDTELRHILRCIRDLMDYAIFESAFDEIDLDVVERRITEKVRGGISE